MPVIFFELGINFPGVKIRTYNQGVERNDVFPDQFLNAGYCNGASYRRNKEMQQEIGRNGFIVELVIFNAFIVEQQAKENNDGAQKGNLRQVGNFFYPAFAENIAVLANKGIQKQPKTRDHYGTAQQEERNSFAHFVQDVFAQGVESDPGQEGGQVIGNNELYFLQISGQSLEV